MSLYTLAFPNYPTAQSAAQALGFWDADADQLKTDGQSQDPQTGEWYGWNITYCGPRTVTPAVLDEAGEVITPAVISFEVYAIVTGRLPAGVEAYLAPFYGYSGHFYSDAMEPVLNRPPGEPGETVEAGGVTWEWTQTRWPDGTFRGDDPETTDVDEAFAWVPAPAPDA